MAFQIRHISENGLVVWVLENSLVQIEIIPEFGALLNAIRIAHGGQSLNLIDGYQGRSDILTHFTSSFKSAKLSPFVCRLRNGQYAFQQQDYTIQRKHAIGVIHGLLFDRPFQVVQHGADDAQAKLVLQYSYQKEDPGYPFDYDCIVEYSLLPAAQLCLSTTVVNKSLQPIPILDGWHPYFTFGDSIDNAELAFQSEEMLEFDEQLIPTGQLLPVRKFLKGRSLKGEVLDHSFLLDFKRPQPLCVLRHPLKQISIAFYPEPSYPVLQVYTPPHRRSIAIENLSGAPDAFNNGIGLQTVEAGGQKRFTTAFKIQFRENFS